LQASTTNLLLNLHDDPEEEVDFIATSQQIELTITRTSDSTNLCVSERTLFADDIVLLAENETNLQSMLNILSNWCNKWGIKINASKSKCMHFRNRRKPCSASHFKIGELSPEYTHHYKYLGFWINEFLDNTESTRMIL